jgi:Sec-independent protein translocase protein TatA
MFEVGFTEIILILGIALVVLGPEKLPKVASEIGRWLGRARDGAPAQEPVGRGSHQGGPRVDQPEAEEPGGRPGGGSSGGGQARGQRTAGSRTHGGRRRRSGESRRNAGRSNG